MRASFNLNLGTVVAYTNWIPGHISNFESFHTEDCVAFIPYKNGKWDDIPCGNEYDLGETHPILCQYSKFAINVPFINKNDFILKMVENAKMIYH